MEKVAQIAAACAPGLELPRAFLHLSLQEPFQHQVHSASCGPTRHGHVTCSSARDPLRFGLTILDILPSKKGHTRSRPKRQRRLKVTLRHKLLDYPKILNSALNCRIGSFWEDHGTDRYSQSSKEPWKKATQALNEWKIGVRTRKPFTKWAL